MNSSKVIFDRGPLGTGTAFFEPSRFIRADSPQDVDRAFDAIQRAQQDGKWLAGYFSYEFGYLMSPKLQHLMPPTRELPLFHFGVFDGPSPSDTRAVDARASLAPTEPAWNLDTYSKVFAKVHDYIEAGDIYQANVTFPLLSRYFGDLETLYARLCQHQPVPHGAMVELEATTLLSRSPELFFSLSSEGQLTMRPMKGTAPRGRTPNEDDALRDGLRASEKNQAENLMIVDLLRNDMSRVSEIGTVKVPELFVVERFATLHQMTSCITSQILQGTTFQDLFTALFPCGSITGAPKVRAMQIIHEVETHPREAYCGSIGWIAPSGAMEFNVAIRTLMCRKDKSVVMNVGGGVVYDSTAPDEYAEALLKSRFADLS